MSTVRADEDSLGPEPWSRSFDNMETAMSW